MESSLKIVISRESAKVLGEQKLPWESWSECIARVVNDPSIFVSGQMNLLVSISKLSVGESIKIMHPSTEDYVYLMSKIKQINQHGRTVTAKLSPDNYLTVTRHY